MYRLIFKVIIDFCLSLIVLIFLPVIFRVTLFLFVAYQEKPFFFQLRPSKFEELFKIIKFKTMSDKKDFDGNLLS